MNESTPSNAPRAGEIFAEKYLIERVLGRGGMGFVMQATHVHLRERVAIKLLLPAVAHDTEIVERFMREARAAIRIRSEHCVRILDVGESADRSPYMVMEYLDGEDLAQVVRSRKTLPPHEAVDYLLQACEALAEAHAMKIVHRDLKPSNLFLQRLRTGQSLVKVLDFGISKSLPTQGDQMSMTRTAAMLGSPLYMSPEQLTSSKYVDERADIWALGVILFELISGKPPFMAESLPELGALVLGGEAPRLDARAPGISRELADCVATCLRKKADDRFVNLSDFVEALAPFGTESARRSVTAVVQTLGMPTTRAVRTSAATLVMPDAQARASQGALPIGAVSQSAQGFATSSSRTRSGRGAKWPFVAVPVLVAALGVGGFEGVRIWRTHDSAAASAPISAPSASTGLAPTSIAATTSTAQPAAPSASASPPSTASATSAVAAVSAHPSASVAANVAAQKQPRAAPHPPPTPAQDPPAAKPTPTKIEPAAAPSAALGRSNSRTD